METIETRKAESCKTRVRLISSLVDLEDLGRSDGCKSLTQELNIRLLCFLWILLSVKCGCNSTYIIPFHVKINNIDNMESPDEGHQEKQQWPKPLIPLKKKKKKKQYLSSEG